MGLTKIWGNNRLLVIIIKQRLFQNFSCDAARKACPISVCTQYLSSRFKLKTAQYYGKYLLCKNLLPI
jgi:hypothetical protein